MDRGVLEEICIAQKNREKVALVTVVNTLGSTPRKAGSQMLVWPDGRTFGSIGGGCAEGEVKLKARMAMDCGDSLLYRVEMLNDIAAQEGMVCGGVMEVFVKCL